MTGGFGRRRFLTIVAAAAGMALTPTRPVRAADGVSLHRWKGHALGAEARIFLHHGDDQAARQLIAACVDEMSRLEQVFSLYRADSSLSRLNRDGALEAPPLDLVRLLGDCRHFSQLTDGAFDVTVQPLWQAYAEHFSHINADPAGPGGAGLRAAHALVDYRSLQVEPARIAFARPGMAATLNGIAQGYITDRVVDLLDANGITEVLVDIGELRALGGHPAGRPWQVGLRDPRRPETIVDRLALTNRALATSAPGATRFDESGRNHHLFDPKTGRCGTRSSMVSVLARDATTADALSTAFCVMPESRVQGVIGRCTGVTAQIMRLNGERVSYQS